MSEFTLRPWRPDDAADIAAAADDPEIAQFLRNRFPSPYTLSDAEWFIGDCIAHEGCRRLDRTIEVGGAAAGGISVTLGSDIYDRSAELGYWLARKHWGRGIVTSAVRQICAEAFSSFDIVRIYAEPFECNRASRRVLEKAGFTFEGTLRSSVHKNGRILSSCMYSILRGVAVRA